MSVQVRRDPALAAFCAELERAALAEAAAPASPTLVRATDRSARVGARPLDPGPPRAPGSEARDAPERND